MSLVSIIVPCYNEEATIELLLEALLDQTYRCSDMEVIISDGLSSDRTREKVANFQKTHPELTVRIVDNPQRIIPAALNHAILDAKGEWIIRLDAHSFPAQDYVERCVEGLKTGRGENVGGVWEIKPGDSSWVARSIAEAAAHPLGVGDARYRVGAIEGEVDTVPFGSFRRELFDRIGFFDETLLANEDYELNVRIRRHGGRVWMDPKIRANYFSRPGLNALMQQYWRYGYWKARMLVRYPDTIRWRQILPPLFVVGLVVLLFLSLFLKIAQLCFAGIIGLYFLILIAAAIPNGVKNRDPRFLVGIPAAISVMHLSWGGGFMLSLSQLFMEKIRG